jgi:hypothetical protein
MANYFLNEKVYNVTQDSKRIYFIEKSDRKNKVHFSFSKDPEKNKLAMDALERFWSEVYS